MDRGLMFQKIKIVLGVVFLWALATHSAWAQEDIKKYTLDNGMTVLIAEMPSSTVFSVRALVKVGSATEGKLLGCGVSHFVEHMLFKGTKKRPVGRISQEVKSLGGYINASTSYDRTMYTLDLPTGHTQEAIDIVADMLMESQFDPKEVEKEREVIWGEMNRVNDDPDIVISELSYKTMYTRHPYQHPIIGYKPLFDSVSRDQLFEFYQTHYIPNNIVLSVAGPIEAKEVYPVIKEAFKDFQPKPYSQRNLPWEPDQVSPRYAQTEYPTELVRLMVTFQGVSIGHRNMFALDVMAMILGQGASSRLYKELVEEKRLVTSVNSVNDTPMDRGYFEIYCLLKNDKIEEVQKVIQTQIELIKKRGVTQKELEKAKRQVVSGYIFNRQTAAAVASDLAVNEAMTGDYDFSRKYVDGIKGVSREDILRVADKYLVESARTVIVLRPKDKAAVAASGKSAVQENDIEKYTLDNGLRVLLKEDHSVPIVTMYLALEGGVRQETEINNGISNLTASLWGKGTTSRSAQEIAESVEAKGGSLGEISGNNSLGLKLNFLKEDFPFALGLLEDLVFHPTFPKDELVKLKDQVKDALREQRDDVVTVAGLKLNELLFAQHPYRLNPLGNFTAIDKIERQDIVSFYQTLSVPSNIVLAIYGDIEPPKVLETVRQKFLKLKPGQFSGKQFGQKPPQKPLLDEVETLDKQQAVVMVGFLGPKLGDPDEGAVETLVSIIGRGMNSRLFMKIREEMGKAYHLTGSFLPGLDTGRLMFYVATNPEDDMRVKEILINTIKEVGDSGVTDEELETTKSYLKGRQLMSLETAASLADVTTLDELYGLGFARFNHYAAKLDQVTKEDVQRVAKSYLDLAHSVTVVTGPADTNSGKKISPH